MNPVLPILAGTLPIGTIALLIMIRWNREEHRKSVVSKHVSKALKSTLRRGVGGGFGSGLLPSQLVIERTGTAYRGRVVN